MRLHPMLAALKHHKAGVVLIGLQIALTLAIVCNALFIIGLRVTRMERPTGVDSRNLFVIDQRWTDPPPDDDVKAADKLDTWLRNDLATLRALPDVASAATVNAVPLIGGGRAGRVWAKPNRKGRSSEATYFFGDERFLPTVGAQLVRGRRFVPDDVHHRPYRSSRNTAAAVIVTTTLAKKLYPQGTALGSALYFGTAPNPATVVGIVEPMQTSVIGTSGDRYGYDTVIKPTRLDRAFSRYVVRAKPGRLHAAMKAARAALFAANPLRVIDDGDVRTFAAIRAYAYRGDRGMAILMTLISIVLLCVTAAGIVGLTSFWVGQRRKQIGVRRALGARRIDIQRYFQLENLLIAAVGAALGVGLAVGLNSWLITRYEMPRLPVSYVLGGALVVLALGQIAVYMPARRASRVPPLIATRSV